MTTFYTYPEPTPILLGRRFHARRPSPGKHVARPISVSEHGGRWVRRPCSGGIVSTEWLWTLRHGGKRLGVDGGLVCAPAPDRSGIAVLRASQPTGRSRSAKLRSGAARCPHPTQSDQGRIISMRTQLLPPIQARRAASADDRHGNLPHWVPMYYPRQGEHARQRLRAGNIVTFKSRQRRVPNRQRTFAPAFYMRIPTKRAGVA